MQGRGEGDCGKSKMRKWIAISLIVVLFIGAGSYYHFVYNTPIKRIERLVKKLEENKRIKKAIDESTKYVESEEFQKKIEDTKERLRIAREKHDNAIPWVTYSFYVVGFIYGCIFLFLWIREKRNEREKESEDYKKE